MALYELGFDDDDQEVGAGRQRPGTGLANIAAIAARASAMQQGRSRAAIASVARAVGRPTVQATIAAFAIQAVLGSADTTATGTAQPLQGIDPQTVTLTAYDNSTASAAGQDLIGGLQVGMTSQFAGVVGIPFGVFAPDALAVNKFSIGRIPAYALCTFIYNRTTAPGGTATRTAVLTIMGETVTGSV